MLLRHQKNIMNVCKLFAEFSKYKKVFLTYIDKLAEYVKFICDTRKIEGSEDIQLIHDCKMKISQLTPSDVAKIKTYSMKY